MTTRFHFFRKMFVFQAGGLSIADLVSLQAPTALLNR